MAIILIWNESEEAGAKNCDNSNDLISTISVDISGVYMNSGGEEAPESLNSVQDS